MVKKRENRWKVAIKRREYRGQVGEEEDSKIPRPAVSSEMTLESKERVRVDFCTEVGPTSESLHTTSDRARPTARMPAWTPK